MTAEVHAPALAAAVVAINNGDPDAGGALVAAFQKGEEVLVPLADDRDHPLAFADNTGKFLAAFTSTDRVVWALPDGPPLAVVDIRQVVGWIVQFGGALRLELSSPDEVTIDPVAAACLLEGESPPDLAALATGKRPPADAASTAEVQPRPKPVPVPPHGLPRYGTAWDETSTAVAQGLADEEARERHERGEPYVAVFPDLGERGGAVVELGPENITTRFLDREGRDDLVYRYRHDSGRLFHDELIVKLYDEGAPRDEPSSVTVLRCQPDGTQRVWVRDDAGEHVTDSYGVDVSGHWDDVPEFGEYDALLRMDR